MMLGLLLDSLFDHAGTFPPESKTFEQALETAANFHSDLKFPFLVNSHLVLKFENLSKLSNDLLNEIGFPDDQIFKISVLGETLESDKNVANLCRTVENPSSKILVSCCFSL